MTNLALSEQTIIDRVYALYEGDTTGWSATSDEYLAARSYCNAAINRWEFYEQTNWKELWTTLDDAASTVTKTITAGTYSYTCPDDMVRPASYVRTVGTGGGTTYWQVVNPSRVASLVADSGNWCYFTGSVKTGFTLHFNPLTTMITGDSIDYEYYKNATTFTATTSTTEMPDPYFIIYFVLSRFFENDGEDGRASKAFQEAEGRLENMRTQNIIGYEGVDDQIVDNSEGFGY